MGLGQSMLSVIALALLGTIMLGVNRNTADNGSVIERTEYEIMATSIGISTIEKATGLAYDENTVNADVSFATSCTPLASLGPFICSPQIKQRGNRATEPKQTSDVRGKT